MEHPPKQGLKLLLRANALVCQTVLMEHPPKQGLKRIFFRSIDRLVLQF